MKRELITFSDNGTITVPCDVRMSIAEIAELFGISYQMTKHTIRSIEKSGIANGDYLMSCTVEGLKVYPDYYGLEMILAVVFQVQSVQAQIFREWLISKVTASPIVVQPISNIGSTDRYHWN